MQFKHFNNKLLVFPTSRAIREYLKHIKEHNALLPTCLTIDEFLKKALSFGDRKLIDEEQRFLYLKEAANIKGLDALGLSADFSFFFKQSDYLFRFFGEVASEKIDIVDLETFDTYEFYKEHITLLNTIFKRYHMILDEHHVVDKINLPSKYQINDTFLEKFDEIGLFFEGYFTHVEFEILQKIAQSKPLFVSLYANEYNQKSLQAFEKLGLSFQEHYEYIVDLSTKQMTQEKKNNQLVSHFNIEAFSKRTNQIAYVKKTINELVEKGIEPESIAVVLPDESFAQQLQLYANEGYFNYAMGLSIQNEKIYKVLKAINDYLNDEEQKAIDELSFFHIDKVLIDKEFKPKWQEPLDDQLFETFFAFILQYEYKDEIIEKLKEVEFKLQLLFFQNAQYVTFKEAVKIILQRVAQLSLDDINSGPVTVMGLLETRAVQFDAVIIVDFNEAYVPKRSVKDKFLSTSIKKSIGLPTPNDRENLQKYYYLRLIGQAKFVHISYVHNENMQISRFASELFNYKEKPVKDKQFEHILFNQHKMYHFNDEIMEPMDLKQFRWSATALKIYLSCQRKFYLQYIAKIKEHDSSLKPKGYELGSIIHEVLFKLYETCTKEEITYTKLLEFIQNEKQNNAYLLLDLEIWKRRLKHFFEYEKERQSFEVIALEKPFEIDFRGIKLKGVIDRIDKVNDAYYILDYKTSSSLKVDSIKSYEKAKDFQLEFYYLACKELFDTTKVKPFYYDLYENTLKEEVVLEQKLELLEQILQELPQGEIRFSKCEDKKECTFCYYKTICDR